MSSESPFGQLKRDIEEISEAKNSVHENDRLDQAPGLVNDTKLNQQPKSTEKETTKQTPVVGAARNIKPAKTSEILYMVLAGVVAACVAFLIVSVGLDIKSKVAMNKLRDRIKAAKIQNEILTVPEHEEIIITSEDNLSASGEDVLQVTGLKGYKLPQELKSVYSQLKTDNENFYGWLSVTGTDIDYPVMQGPDNDFYLSHDINKQYDKYGMLIMDYNCKDSLMNPQFIIYGHNVNSGKLFGELLNYKSEGYYGYHPVLTLDSTEFSFEYEIFAVYLTTVDETQREQGLFTTWGYSDVDEFNAMVEWAKSKSMYECSKMPEYGDAILTLVTCEHSRDEGRFVVMAATK